MLLFFLFMAGATAIKCGGALPLTGPAGVQLFCGPGGSLCPAGSWCDNSVDAIGRYAVCCPGAGPLIRTTAILPTVPTLPTVPLYPATSTVVYPSTSASLVVNPPSIINRCPFGLPMTSFGSELMCGIGFLACPFGSYCVIDRCCPIQTLSSAAPPLVLPTISSSVVATTPQTPSICPMGMPVPTCPINYCLNAFCPGVAGASCMLDYCGGCGVLWYGPDGNTLLTAEQCAWGTPGLPSVNFQLASQSQAGNLQVSAQSLNQCPPAPSCNLPLNMADNLDQFSQSNQLQSQFLQSSQQAASQTAGQQNGNQQQNNQQNDQQQSGNQQQNGQFNSQNNQTNATNSHGKSGKSLFATRRQAKANQTQSSQSSQSSNSSQASSNSSQSSQGQNQQAQQGSFSFNARFQQNSNQQKSQQNQSQSSQQNLQNQQNNQQGNNQQNQQSNQQGNTQQMQQNQQNQQSNQQGNQQSQQQQGSESSSSEAGSQEFNQSSSESNSQEANQSSSESGGSSGSSSQQSNLWQPQAQPTRCHYENPLKDGNGCIIGCGNMVCSGPVRFFNIQVGSNGGLATWVPPLAAPSSLAYTAAISYDGQQWTNLPLEAPTSTFIRFPITSNRRFLIRVTPAGFPPAIQAYIPA